MSRKIYKLKKGEQGASVIEFALILPILIVLVAGIVEFGWILTGYITLTGGAREGVRVAVVGGDYVQAVHNHTHSMSALNVNVLPISEGEIGDKTTIQVKGSLPTLIGFFDFLGESYSLTAEATMRQQKYIAAGPPVSGAYMEPIDGWGTGSDTELTLVFDRKVEIIQLDGATAEIVYRDYEVDLLFDPKVKNNTEVTITVKSSEEGEPDVFVVLYKHNDKWTQK